MRIKLLANVRLVDVLASRSGSLHTACVKQAHTQGLRRYRWATQVIGSRTESQLVAHCFLPTACTNMWSLMVILL